MRKYVLADDEGYIAGGEGRDLAVTRAVGLSEIKKKKKEWGEKGMTIYKLVKVR